jgi:hypothetical protein
MDEDFTFALAIAHEENNDYRRSVSLATAGGTTRLRHSGRTAVTMNFGLLMDPNSGGYLVLFPRHGVSGSIAAGLVFIRMAWAL